MELFEVCVKVRRRAANADAARHEVANIMGLTLNEVKYAEQINEVQEINDDWIRGITSGVTQTASGSE